MGFPGGSAGRNLPANAGDADLIPGQEESRIEEMGTHSSILAWEIQGQVGPGRLQSMASQRVRHYLATKQQQPFPWEGVLWAFRNLVNSTIMED